MISRFKGVDLGYPKIFPSFWSGTSTYYSLAAEIYTCSVETDCDDTISVISLDFRFSEDNVQITLNKPPSDL
jgi:hypothetical protein